MSDVAMPPPIPDRPESCELTILMPSLNEAETIGTCVAKAMGYIRRAGIKGEVLVADNGSTDGSQAIAEKAGARVVPVAERGYGGALKGGIAAARGSYIIMGDSDDSYDFSNLDAFVERLRQGYDLVMGNRFKGGIKPGAMPALHRYLGNPVLTFIGRLFFASPVGDFHCGLRGFRRDSIQRLGLVTSGMEFASEMVVKATLGGYRLTEVPTTLSPDGRSRPPHLRSWRDGWRHLRFLLLFSPHWLFLYPGIILMAAGIAAMIALVQGPVRIGGITFDINTMAFAAAAVVCGLQAVAFWLFAHVFAIAEGLLPESPRIQRVVEFLSLEIGLAAGLVLIALGILSAGISVGRWGLEDFGPLDPVSTMRLVLPSATMLALGFQVVVASFFLSVLGLKRDR